MLEELPETLDETYERILRDINKANRGHAHRLLQCLTVASRPLRVAELAEVLAVDFGTAACRGTSKLNTDWRWEDQQEAVLSTCSSLVSIVDENGVQVVQFSHFSVKEYLTSSRLAGSSAGVSLFYIFLEPSHTILAKACLGTLLRSDEHVDDNNVEKSFPLAQYAAKHWVDHAKFEQVSAHVREAMEDLFDPAKPHFTAWLRVHDMDVYRTEPSCPLHWFTVYEKAAAVPLYYAALCGFHNLAEHLIIEYPQQVDGSSGHYVSPLAVALGREHFDVAQLLYEHGADVDVHGFRGRTPLYAASQRGRCDIVEWLLSHGADPTFPNDDGCSTPLHVAASEGLAEVTRIFIQHKVNQNAPNCDGQTPLHQASERGHIHVARLLLEHGVDVNAQDENRATALHLASENNHLGTAHLLLEHGADVEVEDDKGRTPLQVASGHQYDEITKLLSERRKLN